MGFSVFLIPIITIVTAQITVLDLSQFRFRAKKLFFILGIEFIIQVAICGSVLFLFGYDQYAKWYFFTMDLPACLTFFYIAKRRDLRDLFTVLITIFLNFAIAIPAMWISHLMGDNYLWYNAFRIIFFAIITLLLHRFVRKRYMQLQNEIDKGWGTFSILPLIGTVALYFQYWQYSQNEEFPGFLMNCTMIFIIMSTVFVVFNYIFSQLHEKYLVQEQQRLLTMQSKAQMNQFEQQREAAEKTNRRWHDLRHHTQELIDLLEEGQTEVAIAYLKEQRGVDVVPKEVYCLHTAVNSILSLWAERSRKANIQIEIHTDVPDKLNIEPMELSALFSNAFENAYEGCLRLPDTARKFIRVEAIYNGKRLAIGFTNSCLEGICFDNDMPISSKKGGGIGTRSIAYTVGRFNGTKYFSAEEGVFTARFILYI